MKLFTRKSCPPNKVFKKYLYATLTILSVLVLTVMGCTKSSLSEEDLNIDFGSINITDSSTQSVIISTTINNNNQSLSEAGVIIDTNKDLTYYDASILQLIDGATYSSNESISISTQVHGLTTGVQYYAKFYAIKSNSIAYSTTISFKLSEEEQEEEVVLTYNLPVIFHILYKNENDRNQNIPSATIDKVIEYSNTMLNNTYSSKEGINSQIQLYLTASDDDGVVLDTPGIERIQSDNIVYEHTEFGNMSDIVSGNWDTNRVINIWVYTFEESSVIGMSYIAYTVSDNPLSGLYNGDIYFTVTPQYAHSIQMSNTYISDVEEFSVSLVHELGHYLGLFHPFGDDECSVTNDYCDDTNTYNRDTYTKAVLSGEYSSYAAAMQRTDCLTGVSYTSKNYMDYDFCDYQQFTANQIARMHHVLENSPLVPGADTRAITKTVSIFSVVPEPRIYK